MSRPFGSARLTLATLLALPLALGCNSESEKPRLAVNAGQAAATSEDGSTSEPSQSKGETPQPKRPPQPQPPVFEPAPLPEIESLAQPRPDVTTKAEADAVLAAIDRTFNYSNLPQPLAPPFDLGTRTDFPQALKSFREQQVLDRAWLTAFEPESIDGLDRFALRSLKAARAETLSRVRDYVPGDLEKTLTTTRAELRESLETNRTALQQFSAADPETQAGRASLRDPRAIVAAGRSAMRALQAMETLAQLAEDDEARATWEQQRDELAAEVRTGLAKVTSLHDAIELPLGIDDAELLKSFESLIFYDPKKYGEHAPQPIPLAAPSPLVSTSYRVSRDGDVLKLSETIRTYEEVVTAFVEPTEFEERVHLRFRVLRRQVSPEGTFDPIADTDEWQITEVYGPYPVTLSDRGDAAGE